MTPSNIKLDIIRPENLEKDKEVLAAFTRKNKDLRLDNQQIPGLNLGFNTQEHEEIVEAHRRYLLDYLSISEYDIAYADQVHGNEVQVVEKSGTYAETDALVTNVPGLVLAIQVADCAAILLSDDSNKIIAAVHAGWRGAAADIVPQTIQSMLSLGAQPQYIQAFISPCLSLPNFEVGKEVARKFPEHFVDYKSYRKPHVDLKAFIAHQLKEQGITEEHIEVHEDCTVADADHYYSYRREQQQSGRMLGLIQKRK